jgi:hypothetical protein
MVSRRRVPRPDNWEEDKWLLVVEAVMEPAARAKPVHPDHRATPVQMAKTATMVKPEMLVHPVIPLHPEASHLRQPVRIHACPKVQLVPLAHQVQKETKDHRAMLHHLHHQETKVNPAHPALLVQLAHLARTKTKDQKATTAKSLSNPAFPVQPDHLARSDRPAQPVRKETMASLEIHQPLVHQEIKDHPALLEKIMNLVPKALMVLLETKVLAITAHQLVHLLDFKPVIIYFLKKTQGKKIFMLVAKYVHINVKYSKKAY